MDKGKKEHNHTDGHNHSHNVSAIKKANFIITIFLNFAITAVEVIGGIYSGSLALV